MDNKFLSDLDMLSFLSGSNARYIDDLYDEYLKNPTNVSADFGRFFASLKEHEELSSEKFCGQSKPSWQDTSWPLVYDGKEVYDAKEKVAKEENLRPSKTKTSDKNSQEISKEKLLYSIRALMLIRSYRVLGHLIADLDPLSLAKTNVPIELLPKHYGFTDDDYDVPIFIDNLLGKEWATLNEILVILKNTYCNTSALEYMHITSPEQKLWLQQRIEKVNHAVDLTADDRKKILDWLIEAEEFEKFLGKKYTGTKRFGLDGAEATIPALQTIIEFVSIDGVKNVVIGMPHRGRLNVITSVLGKPYHQIFHEFKGGSVTPDDVAGSGDVKYHLGASSDKEINGNKIHLSLLANPSHLEAVNPVVMGKARARQDDLISSVQENKNKRLDVLPLLLHGDAAFAGQGVVAECFGFSGLNGFNTGGTVHFIVNNQIGFTTSPQFSRSSPYPSDVAKMVEAPIFHVNGNDPEAVIRACKIAMEFRQKFATDIVIDLFCYRRFGHNESDEPKFTQPLMYKAIEKQISVTHLYDEYLQAKGIIAKDYYVKKSIKFNAYLEQEFIKGNNFKADKADWLDGNWAKIVNNKSEIINNITGIKNKVFDDLGKKIVYIPPDFNLHKTLLRVIKNRTAMVQSGEGFDWAMAEAFAFASLLSEGHDIRLSGQDCRRGTFSHRHAHYVDQLSEERFVPLTKINKNSSFEVIDSNLSEFAVLGFEYGYSLENPSRLCLWEAQFGDFVNGAQVIIDQFISSAERKWLRMSGLVLLLPHGYEGQGPEHSSARLERFLQLCAEGNIQVVNITTPANYFHVLRRQLKRSFRKPLIIMSPKSLLRNKQCLSHKQEFIADTYFKPLLEDDYQNSLVASKDIERVIFCSGKVYYDLYNERIKRNINNIYIARIEEIYPFPQREIKEILLKFPKAEIAWCQEEPKNMGAWFFVNPLIEGVLLSISHKFSSVTYFGRDASASPATGLMSKHQMQLQEFLGQVFTFNNNKSNKKRSK